MCQINNTTSGEIELPKTPDTENIIIFIEYLNGIFKPTNINKAPVKSRGCFLIGGGAEIRTPDTAGMNRML